MIGGAAGRRPRRQPRRPNVEGDLREQLAIAADGWGRPIGEQFFSLANVAVCPNAGTTRDVFGNPWELEVRVSDGARDGTARVIVVPDCDGSADPALCRCLCKTTYMPGDCPPFG